MSASEVSAFVQVVFVDLVLAADNAIVIGMAAAGLAADMRRKAIIIGIAVALIMRIVFSIAAIKLLEIPGILIVGGALLLWVSWKLYQEVLTQKPADQIAQAAEPGVGGTQKKSFAASITQILIADVSMSLDNVLAVAGVARHHVWVLVFGLTLSVLLMAIAANYVAGLLERYLWIAWVGLAVIVYVGLRMIYEGMLPFVGMV